MLTNPLGLQSLKGPSHRIDAGKRIIIDSGRLLLTVLQEHLPRLDFFDGCVMDRFD